MAVGGIPVRSTICRTLAPGGGDDSPAIQSALDVCPAGQVVLLAPGTFTVLDYLLVHTAITLRGSGPGVTILKKTNGARPRTDPMYPVDPDTYAYEAEPVVIIGPSRWPKVDSVSQSLTADGSQGRDFRDRPERGRLLRGRVRPPRRAFRRLVAADAGGLSRKREGVAGRQGRLEHAPAPAAVSGRQRLLRRERSLRLHPGHAARRDVLVLAHRTGPPARSRRSPRSPGNIVGFTTPLHTDYRRSHNGPSSPATAARTHS